MDISVKAPEFKLPPEDLDAIAQAGRDYIESWYAADAERIRSCLHPDLAKRTVVRDPEQGTWTRRHTDARMMAAYTQEGRGTRTPPEARTHQITILDTFRNTACVKVVSYPYVDYLHVARFSHRWLIVNALWEPRHGQR